MAITARDKGAARLLRSIGKGSRVRSEVGVLGDGAAQVHEGGATNGELAGWFEYGTSLMPMRSWLRGWIDENEAEIRKRLAVENAAVTAGRQTVEQALARFGVWAVGQIRARISRGIDPPNAESTIARKGSSKPLIDEGVWRGSITNRVTRGNR